MKARKKAVTKASKAKPAAKKAKAAPKAKTSATKGLPTSPITSRPSKAQVYAELAQMTGIAKTEVKSVFDALTNMIERTIKGKGAGEFVIPVGIKVRRVNKPATKARKGRNPFTGEEIQIAAKPARKSVKATAMKALKELA